MTRPSKKRRRGEAVRKTRKMRIQKKRQRRILKLSSNGVTYRSGLVLKCTEGGPVVGYPCGNNANKGKGEEDESGEEDSLHSIVTQVYTGTKDESEAETECYRCNNLQSCTIHGLNVSEAETMCYCCKVVESDCTRKSEGIWKLKGSREAYLSKLVTQ
jgi:hypothetical protein